MNNDQGLITTALSDRKEPKFVSMENIIKKPIRSFSNGKIESHTNHVFTHDLKIVPTSLQIPNLNPNTCVKFNGSSSRDGKTSHKILDMRKICSTILTSKLLHVANGSPSSKNSLNNNIEYCSNDSIDTNVHKESLSSIEMKKSLNSSDLLETPIKSKYNTDEESSDLLRAATPPITSPRLTLSAYRRPETTVRITDCDPSKCLSQKYRLFPNKVLGYGSSSTVRYASRRSDGHRVAVKSIPKHVVLREHKRLEEVALLQRLDHANIVAMHDVYENENEIQMVMEYCEGGELYDAIQNTRTRNFLESYGEKSVAYIVEQLLSALEYIHSRGVVHRDVKPENILLVSKEKSNHMQVKLSDFGLARILHQAETSNRKRKFADVASPLQSPYKSPVSFPLLHTGAISIPLVPKFSRRNRAYSRCGSDFYSAPEIDSGMGYDTSVDIWALGVTTYVLMCGRYPPNPNDWDTSDLFTEPQWTLVSPQGKDILRSMLDPDPYSRITAEEALLHTWINNNTHYAEVHQKPKLDTITLDLNLFTAGVLIDNDDIASSDDEPDDTTSLPIGQFCLV